MLAELLTHPGVEERTVLRSRFGFLALHGGSLERGTAEIATEAATRGGASVYAVLQPHDLRWHVPSHLHRVGDSARLAAFLEHVDVVVSLHGYGRAGHWTTLLLGGANRRLASRLATELDRRLPGYSVVDRVDSIPPGLRGLRDDNPVNVPRRAGVQLELPPRVRGLGPHWPAAAPRPVPHTVALVEALATVAVAETAGHPRPRPGP